MLHVRPTLRLLLSANSLPRYSLINHPRCHRNLLTLAIETSCDDTAVAILEKDDDDIPSTPNPNIQNATTITPKRQAKARLLFNEKITAPNTGLGGIHPIEALESHQASLSKLIAKAVRFLPDAESKSVPASASPPVSLNHAGGRPQKVITINDEHSNGENVTKRLPDFISVTRGPGMRSNLHCGLDTAKGLAVAWSIPLMGVHHMQAHALTPRLVDALQAGRDAATSTLNNSDDDVEMQGQQYQTTTFPFLTLLISGGHTMLLHSHSLTSHHILATTADVAIGDALDKAGRTILPDSIKSKAKDTAFAKHLSDFAFPSLESYELWPIPRRRMHEIDKPDNEFGWMVQAPLADTKKMAFSFTSIPSTVEHIAQRRRRSSTADKCSKDDVATDVEMSLEERKALGRAAIGTAFEHLASRTIIALESLQTAKQPVLSLVVSGGVAANPFLRFFLRAMLDVRGFSHVRLIFPPPWLCTDNAAMIAWCGMEMYEAGFRSELGIGALRKWSMDHEAPDGGILGVGGWKKVDGG